MLSVMSVEILGDAELETIINDFACKQFDVMKRFVAVFFPKKHTLTEWQRPGSLQ